MDLDHTTPESTHSKQHAHASPREESERRQALRTPRVKHGMLAASSLLSLAHNTKHNPTKPRGRRVNDHHALHAIVVIYNTLRAIRRLSHTPFATHASTEILS